ncbi:galactose-6-phosphate isomerase subunit LacA [Eubacterium multiforme]|uniref:Galactose-6-phosphate isomerase n=1 Tax=Eubacterium multiforme TaxID=83339 RepID=A0ABT9URG7_9FIRM|nr:galactose-6-phosphate isomerase subunit LacA [Eubacterium multiforme]MDQ0148783.1 galactose-6-phosphate isomerase [Eubacterium multiforme]
MRILLGADKNGFELKEYLKEYLMEKDYEVIDKTPENDLDFVDSAERVCKGILENEGDRAILIDEYGAGSFMSANKFKNIICAEVSDEHSAYMTRSHNNTSIIAMGSGIVGKTLAKNIVDAYLNSEYAGGRHQIRIDMLNKML